MFVLQLKFLSVTCQHTALEDDSHTFTFNQIVVVIKAFRDAVIYNIIEIVSFINHFNLADGSDTRRVYFRAVHAVLCSILQRFVLSLY